MTNGRTSAHFETALAPGRAPKNSATSVRAECFWRFSPEVRFAMSERYPCRFLRPAGLYQIRRSSDHNRSCIVRLHYLCWNLYPPRQFCGVGNEKNLCLGLDIWVAQDMEAGRRSSNTQAGKYRDFEYEVSFIIKAIPRG